MRIGRVALLAIVAVSSGCSFSPGPVVLAPVETIPEMFSESEVQGDYEPNEWWTAFEDPVLDRLLDTVLVANLDLARKGK